MDTFAALSSGKRLLVVGIDVLLQFGTTFSGLAWAETRRSDHQSVIETWPASFGRQEGTSSEKVPTQLRYTQKGIEWGFQIPASVERFQWFKLGLANGDQSIVGDRARTSDGLTTDYLTELVKHLMYTLEQKIGNTTLETTPIEFCLTVPAIWSEAAKDKTLKACQAAGLKSKTEILLVSEPEAAAIYALQGLDPHNLKIGDTFVLCDAGGGTVDLISYTITALHPTIKVKEAAAGSGEVCGSTFLNRRFETFLRDKLEKLPQWDEEILTDAMERFESVIKKQYLPSTFDQDGYKVPVPGLPNNVKLGIRRAKLTVTPAEMQDIFEPIIGSVIKLVKNQISATKTTVKALLLVGGFGQNNYLKDRLSTSLPKSVIVMQPPNAWTAVVRGAVMMGLARANSNLAAVGLVSRVARKHYGIELSILFDHLLHDASEVHWDTIEGNYRVAAMRWFIKKGDPVKEGQPIDIHCQQAYLVSKGRPQSLSIVVYCDDQTATAPVHKTKNSRKLVILHANLATLSQADLDKTIVTKMDLKDYYQICGSVQAVFSSASTKYMLLLQGKSYDTVTTEYA
ncbi:hypothetical protein D0Z07_7532 [Hyphodiscus hymeniophilus]|uniref:Actin-like ATPase domain-containing protein n=1 Tax=Hyphodiscus hymeniophilus TaxID=353542 RepID=A0A9P6VEM6_9HELO|nr:hypothetical protein D0Z07_7532 [Hyphodiscus hymeniophilus]